MCQTFNTDSTNYHGLICYFANMISISPKTKRFLLFLIKIVIVGGAFYFIYNQLAHNDKLDWQKFIILFRKNYSLGGISFLLLLSVLNRFFEILKWQNLVSFLHNISLSEATKQVPQDYSLQTVLANMLEKLCFSKNRKPKKLSF
jgi:hypothetical protein